MLFKEEFIDYIRENIVETLGESYKNAEVIIREAEKLNSRYTSLQVRREGEEIVPSINLDEAFYKYSFGEEIENIVAGIADIIENTRPDFDISMLHNYDEVKGHLFIRLSNEEVNKDVLASVPHGKELDMVLTYHIALSSDTDKSASVMITDALMDHLEITKSQLHYDAIKNSIEKNPLTVMSIEDALRETLRQDLLSAGMSPEEIENRLDETFPEDRSSGLTVVSNTSKVNGASVLAYPDTLDTIAKKLGGSYYIIPSSIHELLIVLESLGMTSNELDGMVSDVNQSEVSPEERLSDHCYHYDAKEKLLEHGKQYEERIKAAIAD